MQIIAYIKHLIPKKCVFIVFLAVNPLFCPSAIATSPELILYNITKTTPLLPHDSYGCPEVFSSSNNLRRKTGSPFIAKGEPLVLKGIVTDLIGIPLQNATVRIWQANHFGYYNHLVEMYDVDNYDIDFTSNGTAVTNNAGEYAFTTIFPGYYGERTPHIHISVECEGFQSFETEIIFPDHPRNKIDPKITRLRPSLIDLITCNLSNENMNDPNAGKIAIFNIRLNGIHPTKSY